MKKNSNFSVKSNHKKKLRELRIQKLKEKMKSNIIKRKKAKKSG